MNKLSRYLQRTNDPLLCSKLYQHWMCDSMCSTLVYYYTTLEFIWK